MEAYFNNPQIKKWINQIIERIFTVCILTGVDSDEEFQEGCQIVMKLTLLLQDIPTVPSEFLVDGVKQLLEQQLPDARVINNFPAFQDIMDRMLSEGILKATDTKTKEAFNSISATVGNKEVNIEPQDSSSDSPMEVSGIACATNSVLPDLATFVIPYSEIMLTAETKARADAQTLEEALAQAEAKAKADAQMLANALVQAETKAKTDAQALADALAQAETKAKADAQVLAEALAQAETDAQVLAEAHAQAETDAKALAEALSQAETQAKLDAQTLAEALAQAETKAKADAQVLAEALIQAETQLRADAQTLAEAMAGAETQAKANANELNNALAQAEVQARVDAHTLAEALAQAEILANANAQVLAEALAEADALAQAEILEKANAKVLAEALTQAKTEAKALAEALVQAETQATTDALALTNALAQVNSLTKAGTQAKSDALAFADALAQLDAKLEVITKREHYELAKPKFSTRDYFIEHIPMANNTNKGGTEFNQVTLIKVPDLFKSINSKISAAYSTSQVPQQADLLKQVLSNIFPKGTVYWNKSLMGQTFLAQVEDILICLHDPEQPYNLKMLNKDGWKVLVCSKEDLTFPRRLGREIRQIQRSGKMPVNV